MGTQRKVTVLISPHSPMPMPAARNQSASGPRGVGSVTSPLASMTRSRAMASWTDHFTVPPAEPVERKPASVWWEMPPRSGRARPYWWCSFQVRLCSHSPSCHGEGCSTSDCAGRSMIRACCGRRGDRPTWQPACASTSFAPGWEGSSCGSKAWV
ncbi:MAG: hypothetical protein AMXMBFR34_11810 [Myxococcaceae bacterium]